MLRPTLTASALAALLLATACDQNPAQRADQRSADQQAMNEPAAPPAEPAPPATDTPAAPSSTGSEISNEIDQATGTTATFTEQELASAQKVKDVADPGTTLATAAVKTKAGEPVGEVRSVVVGKDGKAEAVVVEVGGFLNVGERAVSMKASKFTYLPSRNILVTEVTKAELEKLPAEKAPAKTP